ncbi:60S ribosomal protein L22 [Clonorchis sinensis]|uniref:Large ribosomal subunit protein eL22 n=1 Tax=Clonorchis sinensis TaxID=79923 RepID=A0A8T1MLU0_CLOSI|nr:60S ribosomal protein L22 [Clonorchis sinensis]
MWTESFTNLLHTASEAAQKKKPQKSSGKKKQVHRFTIGCAPKVIDEDILDMVSLEKYLKERIKVNNKLNNLGKEVHIDHESNSVTVTANIPFSKRLMYKREAFLLFLQPCSCGYFGVMIMSRTMAQNGFLPPWQSDVYNTNSRCAYRGYSECGSQWDCSAACQHLIAAEKTRGTQYRAVHSDL